MKKTGIIVYHSKTGFTRRYAGWLAEETGWPLISLEKAAKAVPGPQEIFLFGSRLHAGTLEGLGKARSIFQKSGSGQLVVFATGAMPGTAEETIAKVWEQNLTEEERREVPHFYLQGGLNYEKMGFQDRMMMRGLSFFMKQKKHKTAQDEELMKTIAQSYDSSSREYLAPMLEELKRM